MKNSLKYYLDLILILAQKEIKVRYKNNILGYFWSILNPLLNALIFYIVFDVLLSIKTKNFAIFLIVGLFPWQWISNYIIGSTTVYISNAVLIKKANFPRFIIPLSLNIQDCFHYILSIPILFLGMLVFNIDFSFKLIIGIPFLIFIQFIFLYGLGLFVATANLFFRDMQNIIAILLQMVFYLTPILYPYSQIPEHLRKYALINIFTPLILSWKSLFIEQSFNYEMIGLSIAYSVLTLALGSYLYRKLSWKFSEAL